MRLGVFSLLSLALSYTKSANADFQGKVETANVGCSITGLESVNGFSANIYSYTFSDVSDYTNTAFYNGDYSTAGLVTTVSLVDEPNFNNNQGYATETSGSLYGVEIPITNFALELTGYFYGMYLISGIGFNSVVWNSIFLFSDFFLEHQILTDIICLFF